ncbi:MAG TPA: class I SAM-dependent methyltransferase [Terriglobales bacterium]|nr:class I SAM-dependent methyltransferase [Terriglobales bacterium]
MTVSNPQESLQEPLRQGSTGIPSARDLEKQRTSMNLAPAAERQTAQTKHREKTFCAASLVPDNVTVLEIGVGTGVFRDLVKGRTAYVGADLQPLDPASIALDLDSDPLPEKRFDYAVLLGDFGYLHQPEAAAKKISDAASHIIASYCCRRTELEPQALLESRRRSGWVNSCDQTEFIQMFSRHGHELISSMLFSATDEFEEFVSNWIVEYLQEWFCPVHFNGKVALSLLSIKVASDAGVPAPLPRRLHILMMHLGAELARFGYA